MECSWRHTGKHGKKTPWGALGEPGHTRDTRAHTGTRITQTNLTNHPNPTTHPHSGTVLYGTVLYPCVPCVPCGVRVGPRYTVKRHRRGVQGSTGSKTPGGARTHTRQTHEPQEPTRTNLKTNPTHRHIRARPHAKDPGTRAPSRASSQTTPLTRSSSVVVTVVATAPRRGSSEGASPTATVTAPLSVPGHTGTVPVLQRHRGNWFKDTGGSRDTHENRYSMQKRVVLSRAKFNGGRRYTFGTCSVAGAGVRILDPRRCFSPPERRDRCVAVFRVVVAGR